MGLYLELLCCCVQDSSELIFGAGINLTKMMEEFTKASRSSGFEYLTDAHTYVDHVANLQVRNVRRCYYNTCFSTISLDLCLPVYLSEQ